MTAILLLGGCHDILADDVVSDARRLARNGQRKVARELLEKRLQDSPGDTDARTLYGTVLSWDANYDEARKQLQQVLMESPDNGDARQALASVELWTGHPAQAADLLRPVLRERPNDTDLLYTDARILIELKRPKDAAAVLRHLLELEPGNRDGQRLLEGLDTPALAWEGAIEEYYDKYSDGIGDRFESQVSLKRLLPIGSVIGRFDNAHAFGLDSNQIEADFYPGIRKGTYAYLNIGFSPDRQLYPRYRLGSDIFQTLGDGFEGTVGYRRLAFASPVNIYTAALSKYEKNWLFTARGYFTPNIGDTSESVQLIARKYLSDSTTYVQFRYGHGATPVEVNNLVDVSLLNSNTFDAALHLLLHGRWLIDSEFGYSREDRINRLGVNHYNANLGAVFRF